MTNREQIDACLRVVSNRCRNLRKTIDRAKAWQTAADNGQPLNEEQIESIRSVPRKEALLVELSEILKKQSLIFQSDLNHSTPPDPEPPRSKRAVVKSAKVAALLTKSNDSDAKSADVSALDNTANSHDSSSDPASSPVDPTAPSPSAPLTSSNPSDLIASDPAAPTVSSETSNPSDPIVPSNPTDLANPSNPSIPSAVLPRPVPAISSTPIPSAPSAAISDREPNSACITPVDDNSVSPPRTNGNAVTEPERERIDEIIAALELKHSDKLKQTKTDGVRATLNFFHVVDFVRQPGSREALLSYFKTTEARNLPRRLSNLDIDLLIYFNVMLTSPNGSVPHSQAVEVSTVHCLEFINKSSAEAFKDTSYATLVDIVDAIASCPILTDRSPPVDSAKDPPFANVKMSNTEAQVEPGQIVEAVTSESALP